MTKPTEPIAITFDGALRELTRLRPILEAAHAIESADFVSHNLLEALREAVRAARRGV